MRTKVPLTELDDTHDGLGRRIHRLMIEGKNDPTTLLAAKTKIQGELSAIGLKLSEVWVNTGWYGVGRDLDEAFSNAAQFFELEALTA